jgi:catechol 2,3-dioxygenase-like lactoylglutathione lyase family enzyme
MVSLLTLTVADAPEVWARLGFDVTDGRARVGTVDLLLAGPGAGRGATAWTLGGDTAGPADLDGLPTSWGAPAAGGPTKAPTHPNGVQRIDHLVVMTPDLERTVARIGAIGLEVRRRRDGEAYGRSMRQAFFWLGDPGIDGVILEVVGPPEVDPATASGPATFFGVAFTVADLDGSGRFFGELMKPPVDAVQPGRRITTLSSKCGATVPIALMSPHA